MTVARKHFKLSRSNTLELKIRTSYVVYRSRPVVPGAMPLTIDSANTHRMSKPAKKEFIKMPVPHPAPAPPHMPNTAENNPAGVATPKFVKDDGNGEAFALEGAEFVENPYERRKNQTETQKELVDLVQSAMDADLEVDMELAVVEGFSPKFTLLPHQVKGRIWMAERETGKKAGGILGDVSGSSLFLRNHLMLTLLIPT